MSYIEENKLQHDFALCIKGWDDLGEEGIFKILKEPEAHPLIFWYSKQWNEDAGEGFMLMTHAAVPNVTGTDDWVKVAKVNIGDDQKIVVEELY